MFEVWEQLLISLASPPTWSKFRGSSQLQMLHEVRGSTILRLGEAHLGRKNPNSFPIVSTAKHIITINHRSMLLTGDSGCSWLTLQSLNGLPPMSVNHRRSSLQPPLAANAVREKPELLTPSSETWQSTPDRQLVQELLDSCRDRARQSVVDKTRRGTTQGTVA